MTLCCLSSLAVAQQPVPIPTGYTVPGNASLCIANPRFSIDNLDILPISPITNYTLSLQAIVGYCKIKLIH